MLAIHEVANMSILYLDDLAGEGYVLVPVGGDWDQADVLFDQAAELGYRELDDGEDEPTELPDGTLLFWLYNPVVYLGNVEGPLWLS